MIRVFVVDDQKLIREQLKYLISEQEDLEIIGTANDGYSAIEKINDSHPDVILMDIEMPGLDGLKAAKIIRQQYANAKIIILTSHEQSKYISKSLAMGANGYILKENVNGEIAEVIRSVHRGYTQISGGVIEKLVRKEPDSEAIEIIATPTDLNSSSLVNQQDFSSDLNESSLLYAEPSKTGLSKLDDWSQSAKDLVDALPVPWTRGLLYLIITCFGLIIPWTFFYHIDDVGTAKGRLEIQGNTVKREADIDGSVAVLKVYVKQGDPVKNGQILMELDSKNLRDEIQQNQVKLEGQQQRLNQMLLMKNQLIIAINTQQQQNQAQQLEKQAQIEQAYRTVTTTNQNYSLQEQEKLAQIRQLQENIKSSQINAELQKQERLNQLKQAQQRANDNKVNYDLTNIQLKDALLEVERYRKLVKTGALAEVKLREVESIAKQKEQLRTQALASWQQSQLAIKEQEDNYKKAIEQSKAELNDTTLKSQVQQKTLQRNLYQSQAEITQSKLRVQEQKRSYETLLQAGKLALLKNEQQVKELQGQITTLENEVNQSKTQLTILNKRLNKYVIKSDFDGIIFDLPIAREGAVVQPKQLLAEIAPNSNKLIFKGQIATNQSESLRNKNKSHNVKLKFDEYPFQKYGVVPGNLSWISPNSKVTPTPQGTTINYDIEVQLQDQCIKYEAKCLPLQSGQSATAEVVIRRRKIIDILLDPFLKLKGG